MRHLIGGRDVETRYKSLIIYFGLENLVLRARSETFGSAGKHYREGVRRRESAFRMEEVFAFNKH